MTGEWSIETLLDSWERGEISRLDFALDVVSNVGESDDMEGLISKIPTEVLGVLHELVRHYPVSGGYLRTDDSSRPLPTERAVLLLRAAMEQGRHVLASANTMVDEDRLQQFVHMWTTRKSDFALVPAGKEEDGTIRHAIEDHSINHGVIIEDSELAREVKRRMMAAGVFVGDPRTLRFKKALIKKRLGRG